MAAKNISLSTEKQEYEFTSKLKSQLFMTLGIGIALIVLGVILNVSGLIGGHSDAEHGDGHGAISTEVPMLAQADHGEGETVEAAEAGHGEGHGHGHGASWLKRLWANLWLCTVYFNNIALVGVFFVAVNYVAWAGWSAVIKRVPEAFGYFLMITGPLLFILFVLSGHDLFHWTHSSLYGETLANGQPNPEYDSILDGKSGYFFFPMSGASGFPMFFYLRLVLYFVLWVGMFFFLRRMSLQEDGLSDYKAYLKDPKLYNKMVYYSAVFLVVFAVTISTSSWDWIMSIDAHWFSTMFGWYNFASAFVAGLATVTLTIIIMKENGYFKVVNEHHLHDLGKFMFAFSIFWTYIWFSQFLLIYYAHIPEETIYFYPRLFGSYRGVFFLNLFINFAFPFLALMTKESKRTLTILKIVAIAILVGHYLDYYMMIMPGTVGDAGGFGFFEFGCLLVFISAFIYSVAYGLTKASLFAKNHPFIRESMHFTQFN